MLDLFLLVGQSNMAGRGLISEEDRRPQPGILTLDRSNQWVNQGEPLHFDKPEAGVGLAFSFARELRKLSPEREIGLIPCAFGGTPQERWMPGADLYESAVARARIAQEKGKVRAILWHQGEAESGDENKALAYGDNLALIVKGFRRDLNEESVPFIAGELGDFIPFRDKGASRFGVIINRQLHRLPSLLPATAVVSASGLGHKGDELHFSAEAFKEFGLRYFSAYRQFSV